MDMELVKNTRSIITLNNMTKDIEFKAYKLLSDIRGRMLSSIDSKAKIAVEYRKSKPEEMHEDFKYIADPAKWDHASILSKENKAVLEVLEYLLNDNQTEIRPYKEWKTIEK